ncbi:MAG: hypothetical protein L7W43_09260 [Rubripirellula sp.]|nr:hypothetical protein [Rhodopirellula sp.]MCH1439833.1 hypothetical protein [Rubripirellula sp.]
MKNDHRPNQQECNGCRHCGAVLNEGADFCRACGSSDSDGWRDDADLVDDDFDYDAYLLEEFSTSGLNRQTPILWRWVAIGLIMLLGLVVLLAFR